MSFSDRPTIPPLKTAGCIAYCVIAAIIVLNMLVGAALSECAPDQNGSGCEYDGLVKFLMFPGSLIVVIVIGVFLAQWAVRDENND